MASRGKSSLCLPGHCWRCQTGETSLGRGVGLNRDMLSPVSVMSVGPHEACACHHGLVPNPVSCGRVGITSRVNPELGKQLAGPLLQAPFGWAAPNACLSPRGVRREGGCAVCTPRVEFRGPSSALYSCHKDAEGLRAPLPQGLRMGPQEPLCAEEGLRDPTGHPAGATAHHHVLRDTPTSQSPPPSRQECCSTMGPIPAPGAAAHPQCGGSRVLRDPAWWPPHSALGSPAPPCTALEARLPISQLP